MSAPADILRLEGLAKRFGAHPAVDGVDLALREGEFFALLGPSGCGKTTLLRLLGGFETPDAGRIRLDGADITATPPHRRPVHLMFQSYALFPHLDVARNIGFGLKDLSNPERAARVEEMLALLKLDGLGRRKPHELSGGQQQRVALARALAPRPRILLLDEPMAALDRKLREETRGELAALQKRLGTTFVVVTHDRDEAMALADRMAVMQAGRIAQVGSPRELYERPASRAVAEFLGEMNLLAGRALRPEAIAVGLAPGDGAVEGRVTEAVYLGDRTRLVVDTAHGALRVSRARGGPDVGPGDRVWLTWRTEDAWDLPA